MRTLKKFKVLKALYEHIQQDEKISIEERNDYLDLLKSLNPTYNEVFNGVRFFPSQKEINLKSFFEGKEGVNIISKENGNFEHYVLPKLPEAHTITDECKECFISGYKFEVTVITSSIRDCPRIFSMNDALAIIADRILATEQTTYSYLESKSTKLNKEGKDNMIYFNEAGGCRELIVTFDKEKNGWKIALMLPVGD